jgi:hypothetical protein
VILKVNAVATLGTEVHSVKKDFVQMDAQEMEHA